MDPQAPPPGWYPDPSGTTRYWDGQQWGPTAPASPQQPEQAGRITIHYGFALLATFSLLGTLLFGIPLITGDDGDGVGAGMGVLWMMWGGMWTLIWTAFAIHHTIRSKR